MDYEMYLEEMKKKDEVSMAVALCKAREVKNDEKRSITINDRHCKSLHETNQR